MVDCAAVANMAHKPNAERCRHNKVHAGYWKKINLIERVLPADHKPNWTKVKAHVAVPDKPITKEDLQIVLNDKADAKCKEANTWHQVPENEEEDWKRKACRALSFLKDAAETLARFPRPKDEAVEYQRAKKGRKLKVRSRGRHEWYWTEQGNWRCKHCWRRKWSEQAEVDYQPCGMITTSLTNLGVNARHHALSAATIDNGPACLIFCGKCGGVAEYYAKKLAQAKCTAPTANCRRNLEKIAAGRHPSRQAALSDTWDLSGPSSNAELIQYLQTKEAASSSNSGAKSGCRGRGQGKTEKTKLYALGALQFGAEEGGPGRKEQPQQLQQLAY